MVGILIELNSLELDQHLIRYQCARTSYKYLKQINLKEFYGQGNAYEHVLKKGLLKEVADLLPLCNEDTIGMPVQALTYFSQIDAKSSCEFTSEYEVVLPVSIEDGQTIGATGNFIAALDLIFERYHQDRMLCDDIVLLMKVFAGLDCHAFKQVFLPKIMSLVKLTFDCTTSKSVNKEQQEAF